MSWIISAVMALIALIATATLWRYHRREVRHLRSSHAEEIESLDQDHHRRVKRLSREHKQHLLTAHHPLASDLLPAMDSLDQALAEIHADTPRDLESFQEGIELARKSLHTALGRHGIIQVAPAPGDPFDPQLHEAISRVEDEQAESGTVAVLLRAGYQHEARVLRPAMVTVFVPPLSQETSPEEAEALPLEDQSSQAKGEPPQEDEEEPSSFLDSPSEKSS